MRAVASPLFFMTVGPLASVGPLLTGLLSHWMFGGRGAGLLRFALATLQIVGLIGATLLLVAGRLQPDLGYDIAGKIAR